MNSNYSILYKITTGFVHFEEEITISSKKIYDADNIWQVNYQPPIPISAAPVMARISPQIRVTLSFSPRTMRWSKTVGAG